MISRILVWVVSFVGVVFLGGCVTEMPPILNDADTNGGRTQAITVHPDDRDTVIIATQFGGLWRTRNGGATWAHLDGLRAVRVADVQYGADGDTVVATLMRDNQTVNGAGIYVSDDGGDTWTRWLSGAIPHDPPADPDEPPRTPERGSAWGISQSLDDPDIWYVGTTYGVAISRNNGLVWEHVKIDPLMPQTPEQTQDEVVSVVALRGGVVLAMLRSGIYKSDDEGAPGSWYRVRSGDFDLANRFSGFSKLARSLDGHDAYAQQDYHTLLFYQAAQDQWSEIDLPEPRMNPSRGPYVRISAVPDAWIAHHSPGPLRDPVWNDVELIWVGQGTRSAVAVALDKASVAQLTPDDWVLVGGNEGVHADMGDLGVDPVTGEAVMLGSDGGVFKPRDPGNPEYTDWTTAAPDGSDMNSLLITDLAGTNVTSANGGLQTDLYFGTQDNGMKGSDNSLSVFLNRDEPEGAQIEVEPIADASDAITVGYELYPSGRGRFSDATLVNARDVPYTPDDADEVKLKGSPYYVTPNHWVRARTLPGDVREIYVSTDNGETWRLRFVLNFRLTRGFRRSNIQFEADEAVLYVAARTGQSNSDGGSRFGLIRLDNLFADTVTTYGTADIITLPASFGAFALSQGSIGLRATEFDWQGVFGVHPKNPDFLIAPDIENNTVWTTRDGGSNWEIDWRLTIATLQYNRYRMWDEWPSRMQVTQISFDPYNDSHILIGTRDAGLICSRDGGSTWRMVDKTEPITYVTGFHFLPNGDVIASSYGRGLWQIKGIARLCNQGTDWVPDLADLKWSLPSRPAVRLPIKPEALSPRESVTILRDPTERIGVTTPSGRDIDGQISMAVAAGGSIFDAVISDVDPTLDVTLRGLERLKGGVSLHLNGADDALQRIDVHATRGVETMSIRLPGTLEHGEHRLELRDEDGRVLARDEFIKAHSDEHLMDLTEALTQRGAVRALLERALAKERIRLQGD